jgi:hypothetical protein
VLAAQQCRAPTGNKTAALQENLGADVAGVEGTGDGGIFCAFEDGAAVGEDGHFIGRDTEAEQKFVVAEVGDGGGEAVLEHGEVENAAALVNLDGIATAHGDVGLSFTIEVGEFATDAGAAVRVARDADGLEVAGPDVAGDEAAMQGFGAAGQELHGFGCFERSDQVNDGAEDADGVAGLLEAVLLSFHQAGEARRGSGADGHGEAVTGHGGGVNPGHAVLDGKIVDQETRLEIVGSIEDEIEAGEQVSGVAWAEVGDDAFHGYTGVDEAELALGGDGLGQRGEGVGFVKEGLALKIRGLDKIAIDDAQFTDAGAYQEVCGGGTDRAASDNNGAGGEQTMLAFLADSGAENLSRVFFVL